MQPVIQCLEPAAAGKAILGSHVNTPAQLDSTEWGARSCAIVRMEEHVIQSWESVFVPLVSMATSVRKFAKRGSTAPSASFNATVKATVRVKRPVGAASVLPAKLAPSAT